MAPLNSGGGSIGTFFGLYISQPTAATTNYALYSEGGTNYFGGNVGVGTATPSVALDVNGTARAVTTNIVIGAGSGTNPTPVYVMQRARNTIASPQAVQSGDLLGSVKTGGYDGST